MSAAVTTREAEVAGVRVTLATFPASWLGVVVGRTSARDLFARDAAVAVALDGPMFDDAGRPQYLVAGPGASAPSQFPDRGATLAVDGSGRARVVSGGVAPAGSAVAVQGYPALVRSRANVASREVDTSRRSRAALGVLADGTVFFAATRAASMYAFAAALVALGAVDAAYTDGGSSTALLLRGESGPVVLVGDANDTGAHATDAKRLPSWLVARGPSGEPVHVTPPTVTPPVAPPAVLPVAPGTAPVVAVAVLLAASGAAAWWVLRSRPARRARRNPVRHPRRT